MSSAPRRRPVVAIDGPAGAGKSTVTRKVAERLGYVIVDTGALYRVVALAAERAGVDFDDAVKASALAEALVAENAVQLRRGEDGANQVLLRGQDVSLAIRAQTIGQGASKVSAHPGVRAALLELQRSQGREGGVVLEGRDIGTVVFPDAEAKFYLTASADVRAQRRRDELAARGTPPSLAEVLNEVNERDRRDSTRPIAPLRQAEDAKLVDSSLLSVEQVVELIVATVRSVERELSSKG
ncbi:MAG TPA: (d)CMP kinase [Polyangiaceae bacterium]|nr:(d)CMP kinase [Polyangiaceae bacterium]